MEENEMTNEQRNTIDRLAGAGLSNGKISERTGLSVNTIKSYLRRKTRKPVPGGETAPPTEKTVPEVKNSMHAETCLACGVPISQNSGHRQRKFCSDKCRYKWWADHAETPGRKAVYSFICPTCGQPFTVYGRPGRKYCGVACSARRNRT